MWGSPRGAANQGRVHGFAGRAEVLEGSIPTGADVRYVSGLPGAGEPALLVQAGSLVQAVRPDGSRLWAASGHVVTRVLAVVGDAERGGFVLVLCGERDVVLLAGDDGTSVWEWRAPTGSNLSGAGSSRLVRSGGRDLWLCFPTYSTAGECFDLTSPRSPSHRWTCDLDGVIDAGFGPVVVVADVLGTGSPQVVLSSRTGSRYGTDESGAVTTAQLVVGRKDGHLLQAVLDLGSGAVLDRTSYRPDPGPYPCARPYGLLQAVSLDPGSAPDIVLVSCQVEEYVAVTSTAPTLARRWGWFVERDWPTDLQELRPQVTSVADVRGDGSPLLVFGHWDGDAWATVLVDPRRGVPGGEVARLPGRYFWGCEDLDGDGVPEIVVSVEAERAPASFGRVEVYDARTSRCVGRRDDVAVVTSSDSDLPPAVAFHAERRGAVALTGPDGRRGLVLVDRQSGRTQWWSPGRETDQRRVLWERPVVRVDERHGAVALTDRDAQVVRLGPDLVPGAVVPVEGSSAQPLCWYGTTGFGVAVGTAQGTVDLWSHDDEGVLRLLSRLDGRSPTVHVDRGGRRRLALAAEVGGHELVRIYTVPDDAEPVLEGEAPARSRVHDLLAFGDEFGLLVNRRTGVHTAALDALDARGDVVWSDRARGAHPNLPAAFRRRGGGWFAAYDDHGVLTVRDACHGDVLVETDWTAAYSTPMYVDTGDLELLVRCDGVHGLEALDLDGRRSWRTLADLWQYYPGSSALVRTSDGTFVAATARDGHVDLVDVLDGSLHRRIAVGPQAEHRPVVTVATDDGDRLLVGTAAGCLLCLDPRRPEGSEEVWRVELGAAVEHVAAASGPTSTLVVASRADGRLGTVRISRPRMDP